MLRAICINGAEHLLILYNKLGVIISYNTLCRKKLTSPRFNETEAKGKLEQTNKLRGRKIEDHVATKKIVENLLILIYCQNSICHYMELKIIEFLLYIYLHSIMVEYNII